MTTLLLIGLVLEDKSLSSQLSIKECADLAAAEQVLLRETVETIFIRESLAADLMELCMQMGLEQVQVIVVAIDPSPKQIRLWHSYGISDVWPNESWGEELRKRYASPESLEKRTEKRRSKLKLPLMDEEEFEDWAPPIPKGRKPKANPTSRRMERAFVIGVAGLKRRSGTTHDAIRFAQTLAAYGEKVACIEILQDAEKPLQVFTSLVMLQVEKARDPQAFRRDGVDFFPNLTLEQGIEIMGSGYAFVVVDFGSIFEAGKSPLYRMEFLRSDIAFVTVTASPWDFLSFTHWENARPGKRKSMSMLVHFADDRTYEDFMRPLPKKPTELEGMGLAFAQMPFDPHLTTTGELKRSVYAQLLAPVLPQAVVRRGLGALLGR